MSFIHIWFATQTAGRPGIIRTVEAPDSAIGRGAMPWCRGRRVLLSVAQVGLAKAYLLPPGDFACDTNTKYAETQKPRNPEKLNKNG